MPPRCHARDALLPKASWAEEDAMQRKKRKKTSADWAQEEEEEGMGVRDLLRSECVVSSSRVEFRETEDAPRPDYGDYGVHGLEEALWGSEWER